MSSNLQLQLLEADIHRETVKRNPCRKNNRKITQKPTQGFEGGKVTFAGSAFKKNSASKSKSTLTNES